MLAFGGIMYNIVIMLFFLISRITNHSITCKCKELKALQAEKADVSGESNDKDNHNSDADDFSCSSCNHRKVLKGMCRVKKTLPYLYWGNVIIFTGMMGIFILRKAAKTSIITEISGELLIKVLCIAIAVVVLAALFLKLCDFFYFIYEKIFVIKSFVEKLFVKIKKVRLKKQVGTENVKKQGNVDSTNAKPTDICDQDDVWDKYMGEELPPPPSPGNDGGLRTKEDDTSTNNEK